MLLGDKGGSECLFGSDKLGERYLGLLLIIKRGILIGAVSECIRVFKGLPPERYVGGEGENGGESWCSSKLVVL